MSNQIEATENASNAGSVTNRLAESVSVKVEVFLGGAQVAVQELMALAEGQTLTLDHQLNEPLELRVGDTLLGYGELVSSGDQFGIKITDIAD